MQVIDLPTIKQALGTLDLLPLIEAGFEAYSAGRANVPPIGELLMDEGEVHIKYGCITGDPFYVIKVASSFHGNPSRGLPPSNGLMLLSSQETGEVVAILHDEAYLTDVRTAVAGAIAAKYLAPKTINRIGIVGAGVQAKLQLRYLRSVVSCRDAVIWGRDPKRVARSVDELTDSGFRVERVDNIRELANSCQLIVTATPATTPLLYAKDIRPGTHISAMGSDTPDKQELEAAIVANADVVVADSIEQCHLRGEIARAMSAGAIDAAALVEIGDIIAGRANGRQNEQQVTVFDSTGVAVQDMMIARAVYESIRPVID